MTPAGPSIAAKPRRSRWPWFAAAAAVAWLTVWAIFQVPGFAVRLQCIAVGHPFAHLAPPADTGINHYSVFGPLPPVDADVVRDSQVVARVRGGLLVELGGEPDKDGRSIRLVFGFIGLCACVALLLSLCALAPLFRAVARLVPAEPFRRSR